MKEFASLDTFSKHLGKMIGNYQNHEHKALDFIGKHIEEKAKETIGHLQIGAGDFESWPELAESTKKDKEAKGYVFNEEYNPLYRTGELKESINHVVAVLNKELGQVFIGSPLDIALYQEMGTNRIPARSFLGLTMFKEKEQIEFILGLFLYNWIINTYATLRIK
jgi:hypothetical protein